MDYASAVLAPMMTTTTLRPLLEQRAGAAGAYRRFVSSGLDNFRMVVAEAGGVVYKYICCDGACPGAPSTAPGPSAPGAPVEMLVDVSADPYDMRDLAPTLKDVAAKLRALLPPAFAALCSNITLR
jgi:hypothetical protein